METSGARTLEGLLEAVVGLDFPVVVTDTTGLVIGASAPARRLLPRGGPAAGGGRLQALLCDPPEHFPAWLDAAREGRCARLGSPGSPEGTAVHVTARPLAPQEGLSRWWLLSLHAESPADEAAAEAALLRRLYEVPPEAWIAEWQAAPRPAPAHMPLANRFLDALAAHVGARCVLLLARGASGARGAADAPTPLAAAGHARDAAALADCLAGRPGLLPAPAGTPGAHRGRSPDLAAEDLAEPPWSGLSAACGAPVAALWIDDLPGLGTVLALFGNAPAGARRRFFADASRQLARILGHARAWARTPGTHEAPADDPAAPAAHGDAALLARGLADELSQPLTALDALTATLLERVESGDDARGPAPPRDLRRRVQRSLARIGATVERLRALGTAAPRLRPTAPETLLREVRCAWTRTQTPGDATAVRWETAPDLPAVPLDAGLTAHAVLSLIQAARAACNGAGAPALVIGAACRDGHFELSVAGDGAPLPTLPQRPGLTLLLAEVLVRRQQGRLVVETRPSGATRLVLRWPLGVSPAPGIAAAG